MDKQNVPGTNGPGHQRAETIVVSTTDGAIVAQAWLKAFKPMSQSDDDEVDG